MTTRPAAPALTAEEEAAFRANRHAFVLYDHEWAVALAQTAERLLATLDREREARADERARLLDADAIARKLTHIRGAHNRDDGNDNGPPCDWCRLAADQAVQALALLADPPS